MAGFEPATFRLTAERSTDWATRAYNYLIYIILLKPSIHLYSFKVEGMIVIDSSGGSWFEMSAL